VGGGARLVVHYAGGTPERLHHTDQLGIAVLCEHLAAFGVGCDEAAERLFIRLVTALLHAGLLLHPLHRLLSLRANLLVPALESHHLALLGHAGLPRALVPGAAAALAVSARCGTRRCATVTWPWLGQLGNQQKLKAPTQFFVVQ
jgi:hypothetical protein